MPLESQYAGAPGAIAKRPPTRHPPFPLSSPQHKSPPTVNPNKGGIPRAAGLPSSPNPFHSGSSDDESGSSSGQDEFHLERYSQEAASTREGPRPDRKPSTRRRQQMSPLSQPGKRPRPDLNIVTNFSMPARRLQTKGLVIDHVASQRPRLGPRHVTSIASAKAEHLGHSAKVYTDGGPAVFYSGDKSGAVNIHERLTDGSKQKSVGRQGMPTPQGFQDSREKLAQASRPSEVMPPAGLAPALVNQNGNADGTPIKRGYSPGSRSIVIGIRVPENEAEAHRSIQTGNRAHSVNPPDTPAIVITPAEEADLPKPSFLKSPTGVETAETTAGISIHQGDLSLSKKYQEDPYLDSDDDNGHLEAGRASSDSQERILSFEDERNRHKSQGWWNLMLSPVLSRKGTLVRKQTDDSLKTPPVPSIPAVGDPAAEDFVKDPVWPATFDPGHGLAAEYYHACAVEQVKGLKYFDCQNHSCEKKLPQLHSVFDPAPRGIPAQGTKNGLVLVDINPGVSQNMAEEVLVRSQPTEKSVAAEREPIATTHPVECLRHGMEADTRAAQEDRGLGSNEALPASIGRCRPDPYNFNIAPPVLSPGPVSPAMQRTMTSKGAVLMTEVRSYPNESRLLEPTRSTAPDQDHPVNQTQPVPIVVHNHSIFPDTSMPTHDTFVGQARKDAMERLEANKGTPEPKQVPLPGHGTPHVHETDGPAKKSILSKIKYLNRKKVEENETSKKKKRRWTLIISIILFLIVLACILLATLLTRSGDPTPVGSQWLNLTGYPPIPTGISTLARPDAVKEQSQCVAPTTLWSCALPKENQAEVAPNNPDQPNFRFQISFRNGTVPANLTIPVRSGRLESRANDPFTNDLFEAKPSPPSRAEQIFMGNTTDNITQPFEGEQTPFFITFMPAFPADPSNVTSSTSTLTSARLLTRQSSNGSNAIPPPDVLDDGSAAPANLLPTSPYPSSQPIKLYNRGQVDEHFGFYTYYDKAIFLHSTSATNVSELSNNGGIDPEDANGGSTRNQSRLRCTFSQTRFLVRMWTNPAFGATLLSPTSPTNGTDSSSSANSATDFDRPGSFPYPTTISLDRHGGNINKKAVYCYGVNDLQVIQADVKTIVAENRGVDGILVNPAPALVNGSFVGDGGESFDQDAGGIDGGTGGCECVWQNWS